MIHLSQGNTADPRQGIPTSAGLPPVPPDRDVPIDRFSHPSFPFFEAAPTGAVFSMQKRTRSDLSELRRTHNMHDWTLNGIDHPAVHFNVEQKGKGSSPMAFTQFTHETIPQKMTGNSSRLR